ncbi:hypothetical protein [Paenibacillus donghaensis]|uniref:Uncharacterized protein n=1 Tax=Paenibacillus donghaensis TaxID=414771 RepID=A0A2Z2KAP1_9BACL|nr:hypothetical protein [Paenibacillus donghaensis]ASA22694.1 hypothetical protein B9T62_18995 [Paenibacillus donghaensis]
MTIDKELVKRVKEVSSKVGGYLTTELYDKNRGDIPAWKTLKNKLNITFPEFLKLCGVLNKEEYLINVNKIKAVSNLKILALEYGEVSKVLYESSTPSLLPSYDYICKHYGWSEIVCVADVKMANAQYATNDNAILELKQTIKKLGYIPTSKEYDIMNLKPSQKVLRGMGLSWVDSMRKAGYRPYGKAVAVKDKICVEKNCFRQFTPEEGTDIFCLSCFKAARQKIINDNKITDKDVLADIYTSTSQNYILKYFC